MELKMESEKRKKKAIEDLMARELEKTVVSSGRSQKRHHDDRDKSHSYKRYRHEDSRGRDYDSYRDEGWERSARQPYDNR